MNIVKKEKTDLKLLILDKLTDYDIFHYYLGNFKVGKAINSPFKTDTHPSLLIGMGKDGRLFYRDMRGGAYYGDCFRLVMQLYGLGFIDALNKITQDFGLLGSNVRLELINKEYKNLVKEKKEKVFKVADRPFTIEDLKYWEKYFINEDVLRRENIFSIKSAWIDEKKLRIEKDELAFAYYFKEIDRWKLYFPRREKGKWFCNLPGNHYVEGKSNLLRVEKGILTKSTKDRLVLSRWAPTANVQNESESAFNGEFVSFLKENVGEVYLAYDSDKTGKENSKKITSKYGFKHLNVPNHLVRYGVKDFSDWVAADGLKNVEKFLIKKRLI